MKFSYYFLLFNIYSSYVLYADDEKKAYDESVLFGGDNRISKEKVVEDGVISDVNDNKDSNNDDDFGSKNKASNGVNFEDSIFSKESPSNSGSEKSDRRSLLDYSFNKNSEDGISYDDPLKIGGQLYFRTNISWKDTLEDSYLGYVSSPMIVDTYFDARLNDRVRGFFSGRIQMDPTAVSSNDISHNSLGVSGSSPTFLLNQLWFRFDIARRVFVTLGKQNVKWGVGHFWNPQDYLQAVKKNPFESFDIRGGVNLLKLHLPWERKGWNFYAISILDRTTPHDIVRDTSGNWSLTQDLPKRIDDIGFAIRSEMVFGTMEIGLDAVFQKDPDKNRLPIRVGSDISSSLGPFDIYADLALSQNFSPTVIPFSNDLGIPYTFLYSDRVFPSISAGLSWQYAYNEQDSFIVGAEYFWNPRGYTDKSVYPYVIASGFYQPFYTGQHYIGSYIMLPGVGKSNDISVTLSWIGNLSDKSHLVRADFGITLLTYLQCSLYSGVHLGERGGEFRLGWDPVIDSSGTVVLPELIAPIMDAGLSLKLKI